MIRPSLLVLAALLACKSPSAAAPPPEAAKPDPHAAWKALADAPDRSDADRKLDPGRHPAEMLEFLDPKPGMKAADLGAGGGYTTELLARAVAPGGVVYMQNDPSWLPFLKDAIAERFTHAAAKNIVRVDRPFEDPLPTEAKDLDLVVMNVIYHDVVNMPVSRLRMNRAIFNALKPGGTYVVGDSSAKPGSGISATSTLHRIDEQVVRDEVQQAGFKLVQEGAFLRNPQDTREWNSAPGPSGERRGTSDRFILKFVRPEGSQQWPLAPTLKLPPGARPVRDRRAARLRRAAVREGDPFQRTHPLDGQAVAHRHRRRVPAEGERRVVRDHAPRAAGRAARVALVRRAGVQEPVEDVAQDPQVGHGVFQHASRIDLRAGRLADDPFRRDAPAAQLSVGLRRGTVGARRRGEDEERRPGGHRGEQGEDFLGDVLRAQLSAADEPARGGAPPTSRRTSSRTSGSATWSPPPGGTTSGSTRRSRRGWRRRSSSASRRNGTSRQTA